MEYAILLAKTRSFSQVADSLGISQPFLSKQILSLEQELGIKLFDRSTIPLTITAAGEYFIQEAKDLLYKENQLLQTMEAYKSGDCGKLVIGISPFRSLYLMPGLIKKIKTKYPNVEIVLKETGSEQLRQNVAEGKYDFAIINLPVDTSILNVTPINPDILLLAVPNSMASSLPSSKIMQKPYLEIDFKDCQHLPFIVVSKTQELRHLFEQLCSSADFHPNISVEVIGVTTAWALAHAGIGATLVPLQFIENENYDDEITLFSIKSNLYSRQPAIITKKGQYLSKYAEYAISLLKHLLQ